jgi:UDP-N-acetylmuramoyl-L-alanyl-D-glutamate--2,6-diaminopimelate ligase
MTPTRSVKVSDLVAWLHQQLGGNPLASGAELTIDSRRVLPGDVFLAIKGAQSDGRDYIARAISQGAKAILYEESGAEGRIPHPGAQEPVPMKAVSGLAELSAALAAEYYRQPSRQLKLIAITGTNGKTSCAHWIAQGFHMAGHRAAIIGTLGAHIVGQPDAGISTGLTTPDAVAVQSILARFVRQGVQYVAMEASSIGLEQGRMAEISIDTAVFTNFTQDHLDYHRSMADYLEAKKILFRWPGLRQVVLNWDDEQVKAIRAEVATGVKLFAYSIFDNNYRNPESQWLYASPMSPLKTGMSFYVNFQGRRETLQVGLMGRFNVSNLLAVMSTWMAYGMTYEQVMGFAMKLTPVPGRMELIQEDRKPLAIVDYAHTPDAIAQVLDTLRPAALLRGGDLWIVFGAGGNRDESKRPQMASLAEGLADFVVLTSDNPRFEQPFKILSDLRSGLRKEPWLTEPDRRRAIEQTLASMPWRDIVVIAGKGHENYQEIEGIKHPFSDVEIAKAALAKRAPAPPPEIPTSHRKRRVFKPVGTDNA